MNEREIMQAWEACRSGADDLDRGVPQDPAALAEDPALRRRFEQIQHQLLHHDAYNLDHRIERILEGIGCRRESFTQEVAQLSGGQQNRLLLAKLLLAEPDLMLLDEPSNHLDIDATEWLEDFLIQSEDVKDTAVLQYTVDTVASQKIAEGAMHSCHHTRLDRLDFLRAIAECFHTKLNLTARPDRTYSERMKLAAAPECGACKKSN